MGAVRPSWPHFRYCIVQAKDDQDGGQQLLDEGLAALFGKKRPAREGDIALYLKRMFNEKPDDDDIACLAGMLSMHEDSSDEEDEAQPEQEAQPEEDEAQPEPEAQPEEGKAAGGKLQTVEAVDTEQTLVQLAVQLARAPESR